MSFAQPSLVLGTSVATGTSDPVISDYKGFDSWSAIADTNQVYYTIRNNPPDGVEEQGLGTKTTVGGKPVLQRTAGNVIKGSSGVGVKVNFTAQNQFVYISELGEVKVDPNVTSDPTVLVTGQRWFRTDLAQFRGYQGSTVSFNTSVILGLPQSPATLQPVLWYDAQSIIGLADGAAITTQVFDISKGHDAADSVGTGRPTYKLSSLGGKPAIRFDGVANFLRSSSFSVAQPITMYLVYQLLAIPGTGSMYLSDGNGGAQLGYEIARTRNDISNAGLAIHGIYAGSGWSAFTPAPFVSTISIAVLTYNGTSSKISINGSSPISGSPGSGGISTGFCFGAAGNLSLFSNYDLGEVIVFSGVHTQAQQAAILSYLANKWPSLVAAAALPPQVYCDGDSLTLGNGAVVGAPNSWGRAGSYPSQLNTLLGGPSKWILYNAGIASETAATMLTNIANNGYYSTSFAKNLLCIWGGTNDLWTSVATPAQVYTTLKSYWANRRAVGWKVIAFTILPRTSSGGSATFEADRQTLNTLIKSDTTLYDALVDVAADPNIGPANAYTNTTYYASDQVHLTSVGYSIVAALAQAAVLLF